MLAPIRPRPIIPSCIHVSPSVSVAYAAGCGWVFSGRLTAGARFHRLQNTFRRVWEAFLGCLFRSDDSTKVSGLRERQLPLMIIFSQLGEIESRESRDWVAAAAFC